jgi:hypothetical protein
LLLSLCYLVCRRVLELAILRCRSDDRKELEIIVLRHELGPFCVAEPGVRR